MLLNVVEEVKHELRSLQEEPILQGSMAAIVYIDDNIHCSCISLL